MKCIKINDLVLGEGTPKICAPLVEHNLPALLERASSFPTLPIDIAEWRADCYNGILDPGIPARVLPQLSARLKGIPLLFTFRTHREGGSLPAAPSSYRSLTEEAICSGCASLVDVEFFSGDGLVKDLIALAHEHGVKVVLSNHDFSATPSEEEMLCRLSSMEKLGADIVKIAVTPRSPLDVLSLLSATVKAREQLSCPVISMSMKGQGLVSRLGGEVFGSCLTFGSAGEASAPGQIDVNRLRPILDTIHAGL